MSTFEKPGKEQQKRYIWPYWKIIATITISLAAGIILGWVLHTDNTTECFVQCDQIQTPTTISNNGDMIRDYRAGREQPENEDEEGKPISYTKTENIVVNSADLLQLIKKIKESDEADSIVLVPAAFNERAATAYLNAHPGSEDVRGNTTVLFGIVTYPAAGTDPLVTSTPTIQLYRVATSICPPPMTCAQVQ